VTQAVELVEGVEVQLGQELVPGDQELKLAGTDVELLLDDVGLEREHLGEAGVPVGFEPGLVGAVTGTIRRSSAGGRAEEVAELPLGGDHIGGLGHQVEAELFEPLLRFGDVADGAAADLQLGILRA